MKRIYGLLILCLAGGCAAPAGPAAREDREDRALGGVRQLTRDYADATDAALSPDGRWVAFRAVPRGEGAPQLFLARALYDDAGGDLVGLGQAIRATPPGSRSNAPAFAADGQTLLFAGTARADGEPPRPASAALDFDRWADLFRVDGWPRHLAAADPRAGVDLARRKLAARPGYDAEPALAPDGRFVVFVSDRDAPPDGGDVHDRLDLYAMRFDGTNVVRLTGERGRDGAPAVSADGRRVVFESDRGSPGEFDLYEITLTFDETGDVAGGSPARRLTTGAAATRPVYAGEGVLYASDRDDRRGVGNRELHFLDLQSGRDARLTFDPAADDAPHLGRDGRVLLFSSRRTRDGSRQIFAARFEAP